MKTEQEIVIAVSIIFNADNELLVVRKRGSRYFQLPGGKLEVGEKPLAALLRELNEELGVEMNGEEFVLLGRDTAEAVNERGSRVCGYIFRYLSMFREKKISSQAELAEIKWLQRRDWTIYPLANLLKQVVPEHWKNFYT